MLSCVDYLIYRGGHPVTCLLSRLGSKHKLVRTAEELLDCCLELVPCGIEGYAVPVMLLQSNGGLDRNTKRSGDYLSALYCLGFCAGPDYFRIEAAEAGGQQLRPLASDLAESPGGCRPIGLYLGHRMFHQYEPAQGNPLSRCSVHSTGLRGVRR